jgi:hypothetical protein
VLIRPTQEPPGLNSHYARYSFIEVSKATVSRDFALVRRIHRQFRHNFGPKTEKIFWSWTGLLRVYDSREHKGRIRGACRVTFRLALASRNLRLLLRVQSVVLAHHKFYSQLGTRELISVLVVV